MSFLDDLGSVVGAITGIGNLITGASAASATHEASGRSLQSVRETNAMNLQIARENNEAAKALWREQSEYNSPANQMARYIQAGLNPNLMASSGQVNSGNAGSPPTLQQAHVAPYTGFVRDAQAKYQSIKEMINSGTTLLQDLANLQKTKQEIKTSQAQEENFRSSAARSWADMMQINSLRPLRYLNLLYNNNWLGYRQAAYKQMLDEGTGWNPFVNQFALMKYNADVRREEHQKLNNENLLWSLYGLETAAAKLGYIKSATKRNQVASEIQYKLAPALYRKYMSSADLTDTQEAGQDIMNQLHGIDLEDKRTGGDQGINFMGLKFNVGGLKRGYKYAANKASRFFHPLGYYYNKF